ncbi:MAG: hypothetical protein P3A28_04425 [Gemmatimonadota bacterium]|nr:hypothetical protein [Gemmatimonadota bacterium]
MTRAPRPSPAAHFDRPADVAAHIASQPAVVVAAADPQHAAQFAVAIAKSASASRRVALADLVGDLGAVYALAGGEDAAGLTECFRDNLALSEVARTVEGNASLFILPAGSSVRFEPSVLDPDRWARLIRGFGEAGGLLIAVCSDSSPVLRTLGEAGAQLLYAGSPASAPAGVPLLATIGAVLAPPVRTRAPGTLPGWVVAAAAVLAVVLAGAGANVWVRRANAPDGQVLLEPARRVSGAALNPAAPGAPAVADTVALVEQLTPEDSAVAAEFAIEVVAANTASNANSLLADVQNEGARPAATISVIPVRSGVSRAARWHKVMYGAWRAARSADSALRALREDGVVRRDGGAVIRAPFGLLLADGASPERARAVMDVWRAKGVAPYALAQEDGTVRVYAGAFETVAQALTMAALVREAGGVPIVAYRTGRSD